MTDCWYVGGVLKQIMDVGFSISRIGAAQHVSVGKTGRHFRAYRFQTQEPTDTALPVPTLNVTGFRVSSESL